MKNAPMKILFLSLLALIPAASVFGQISVVDMIPAAQSDETFNNTEPFISVNPNQPLTIGASAFASVSGPTSFGALFVSYDGGNTWGENNILPSSVGSYNTGDITFHYATSTGNCYFGILWGPGYYNEKILRSTDPALNTPMTFLWEGSYTQDQPFTDARTVLGWYDPGKERFWIGDHDLGSMNEVEQSMDATASPAAVSVVTTDTSGATLTDNFQCRTRSSADGRIYTCYYRRLSAITNGYDMNVMMRRDDNWGQGATPFTDLNGAAGVTVAASVPVPVDFSSTYGNEIVCGELYLAVDPNDSSHVLISWLDSSAAEATLHLRESFSAGQTWAASDLLTVSGAKNGEVAINSQGKIAYMYQILTGSSPNRHWQTHLRRYFGGTWDDTELSDFPAEGSNALFANQYRIIGDYAGMVAVGKNFYGVFSADNDPNNATFPAGVTYLRNRTAPGVMPATLFGSDGTTPVSVSIDPFFFKTTELNPSSDFYVRDWTDSYSSYDHGLEPSTRADFFSTSDVWNMRSSGPASFNASGQPNSQDPQPMAMGHNYAFARVSREASTTSESVTLDFLYSDGGVGVNYFDAGSTVVSIGAGVSQFTPASGFQWDLPSGASDHVCLAVQISTAADPFIPPGLSGHAPGWPNTDLWVINDNNKAQRNMQVLGYGGTSGAPGLSAYFLAHNAATFTRDMVIGVAIDPSFKAGTGKPLFLKVLGGPRPQTFTTGSHGTVTLVGMTPGENRWIEATLYPGKGQSGSLPVHFYELVKDVPVNGYLVEAQAMSLPDLVRQNVLRQASVFNRLVQIAPEQKDRLADAVELAKNPAVANEDYLRYLKTRMAPVGESIKALVQKSSAGDPFGLEMARAQVEKSASNLPQALAAHLNLLNKLDAMETMVQKQEGDAADIPQMVQWGLETYRGSEALRDKVFSREVVRESQDYLSRFQTRKASVRDYPALVKALLPSLEQTAQALPDAKDKLEAALAEMKDNLDSAAHLEKAYRDFLTVLAAQSPASVQTAEK